MVRIAERSGWDALAFLTSLRLDGPVTSNHVIGIELDARAFELVAPRVALVARRFLYRLSLSGDIVRYGDEVVVLFCS